MTHPAAELLRAIADGKQMEANLAQKDWGKITSMGALTMIANGFSGHLRIARPMLTVSYTVPMPVKEALEVGQRYWLAGDAKEPIHPAWDGEQADNHWLREGRIYLTREDAQQAIDARNAAYGEAMK